LESRTKPSKLFGIRRLLKREKQEIIQADRMELVRIIAEQKSRIKELEFENRKLKLRVREINMTKRHHWKLIKMYREQLGEIK